MNETTVVIFAGLFGQPGVGGRVEGRRRRRPRRLAVEARREPGVHYLPHLGVGDDRLR